MFLEIKVHGLGNRVEKLVVASWRNRPKKKKQQDSEMPNVSNLCCHHLIYSGKSSLPVIKAIGLAHFCTTKLKIFVRKALKSVSIFEEAPGIRSAKSNTTWNLSVIDKSFVLRLGWMNLFFLIKC